MAITHQCTEPRDTITQGTWQHDYGQAICTWIWDAATRHLIVKVGARGKRFDLSKRGEQNFTATILRERLPGLAIAAAEEINGTKYDV
jgi:hypothetical protein